GGQRGLALVRVLPRLFFSVVRRTQDQLARPAQETDRHESPREKTPERAQGFQHERLRVPDHHEARRDVREEREERAAALAPAVVALRFQEAAEVPAEATQEPREALEVGLDPRDALDGEDAVNSRALKRRHDEIRGRLERAGGPGPGREEECFRAREFTASSPS